MLARRFSPPTGSPPHRVAAPSDSCWESCRMCAGQGGKETVTPRGSTLHRKATRADCRASDHHQPLRRLRDDHGCAVVRWRRAHAHGPSNGRRSGVAAGGHCAVDPHSPVGARRNDGGAPSRSGLTAALSGSPTTALPACFRWRSSQCVLKGPRARRGCLASAALGVLRHW